MSGWFAHVIAVLLSGPLDISFLLYSGYRGGAYVCMGQDPKAEAY